MWLYPTIIVCTILCLMGYYLTVRVGHKIDDSGEERDQDVSEKVIEHPIILNPIILSYVIFLAFTGIIIFYYWARGY